VGDTRNRPRAEGIGALLTDGYLQSVTPEPDPKSPVTLHTDETVLRRWRSSKGPSGELEFTLTDRRIMISRPSGEGGRLKVDREILASKPLEEIAEPRIRKIRPHGLFAIPVLDVAGFETFGNTTEQSKTELLAIANLVSAQRHRRMERSRRVPSPGSEFEPPVVQHVITREVVKVPCRNCRNLVEYSSGTCDVCGATLHS
jgi:hypothetical protein